MLAGVQKNDSTMCMNSEANDVVDLIEDKLIDTEQGVKVVGKYLKSLSFHERMKGFLPHRRPLKERMKDKTILYVELL
jgi:hypothetical protein